MEQDEALFCRFLSGEEDALRTLMDRYGNRLTLYISGMICDLHDAKDLMLEAFSRIIFKRPKLVEHVFKPYLFKIGRNLALRMVGGGAVLAAFAVVIGVGIAVPEMLSRISAGGQGGLGVTASMFVQNGQLGGVVIAVLSAEISGTARMTMFEVLDNGLQFLVVLLCTVWAGQIRGLGGRQVPLKCGLPPPAFRCIGRAWWQALGG